MNHTHCEKPYLSPRRLDPNNEDPFLNIREPNPLDDRYFSDKDAQISALKALVLEAGGILKNVREHYGSLHDQVNDLIGEGVGDARLTEDMIPDDYDALVTRLVECVSVDFRAQNFLEEVIDTRYR
jgi:hypothetical protein